jgi:hypothetical protein
MIRKAWLVTCDGCEDELTFTADDCPEFLDVVREIREHGWRVSRDAGGDWTHTCAQCRRSGHPGRLL